MRGLAVFLATVVVGSWATPRLFAQVTSDAPAARPDVVVDLATHEGVRGVKGEWRYSNARIIEIEGREPGPDLRPSGPANRTYDITPHAGSLDFDDSGWQVLEPTTLDGRRSTGRLSFNWYRLRLTIPERVGSFETNGSTVVFEIVIDDYAEIWVDGKLPIALGQTGGHLVKGFNAPNRVVIARNARPGQQIQLAVFGINAPISSPPGNFIWIRSATLEFYQPDRFGGAKPVLTEIVKVDPKIDEIVPAGAQIEQVAGGFLFIEGPVWIPDGYLLFSDPNANLIYRWTPDGQVSVFRTKSGYSGVDIGEYGQPGSNGLTLDSEGRLTMAEHGNRRITRLERNGVITVLADRHQGKRLNSPNDLVYKSDGTLYFTDPPFGLPKFDDDPRKELRYNGIYRLVEGRLELLSTDLKGPNGLAFSPDEKFLYATNWDPERKIVMRYDVKSDGTIANGGVFFDMTSAPGEEALDGVKVDRRGNLYVSGPGGIWVIAPNGQHLGTIKGPELPANFAWGDEDGRTLYMTARTGLYRLRLNVPGCRP